MIRPKEAESIDRYATIKVKKGITSILKNTELPQQIFTSYSRNMYTTMQIKSIKTEWTWQRAY